MIAGHHDQHRGQSGFGPGAGKQSFEAHDGIGRGHQLVTLTANNCAQNRVSGCGHGLRRWLVRLHIKSGCVMRKRLTGPSTLRLLCRVGWEA